VATTIEEGRLNTACCGQWGDERAFEVTRERIAQFAAATNDPIAQHRTGGVAPPAFGAMPGLAALVSLITESIPANLVRRTAHRRQQLRFHRPVLPGTRLKTRGKVLGYAPVEQGTEVLLLIESRDGDDELVVEQISALRISRFHICAAIGEAAPWAAIENHMGVPIRTALTRIDDQHSSRYVDALGAEATIPLDIASARATELQHLVAQGLRALAFAAREVLQTLANGDRAPVTKRLSAELISPIYLYPGCRLATTVCRTSLSPGLPRLTFHSLAGRALVLRGTAEFS
jgi:acyl dehydratase